MDTREVKLAVDAHVNRELAEDLFIRVSEVLQNGLSHVELVIETIFMSEDLAVTSNNALGVRNG